MKPYRVTNRYEYGWFNNEAEAAEWAKKRSYLQQGECAVMHQGKALHRFRCGERVEATPPYIKAERLSGKVYRGTIILNGEKRWSRIGTAIEVARQLQKCLPGIEHVITDDGEILPPDCLTLAECIEASAT